MKVTILGSTGTIGRKALDVCLYLELPVYGLVCNSSRQILAQILLSQCKAVAISNEQIAEEIQKDLLLILHNSVEDLNAEARERLSILKAEFNAYCAYLSLRVKQKLCQDCKCDSWDVEHIWQYLVHEFEGLPQFYVGKDSASKLASVRVDRLVAAMVGFVGLEPVIKALKAGSDICLANKETLIAAGELIMPLAKRLGRRILPVDSEHSAIFQCLNGSDNNRLQRILLTASGGPFRETPIDELAEMTAKEALAHPIWDMGAKITIDSATMMNKGLELIEACHLFGVRSSQVEVVVHPQSIIHSAVEFADGGVIAQLGVPDMYLPIQYALTWPKREPIPLPNLDLFQVQTLTFEKPDLNKFPALRLAKEASELGGTLPCVLNAANEVAVHAFLDDLIKFADVTAITEQVMAKFRAQKHIQLSTDINDIELEQIIECDRIARQMASELVR